MHIHGRLVGNEKIPFLPYESGAQCDRSRSIPYYHNHRSYNAVQCYDDGWACIGDDQAFVTDGTNDNGNVEFEGDETARVVHGVVARPLGENPEGGNMCRIRPSSRSLAGDVSCMSLI